MTGVRFLVILILMKAIRQVSKKYQKPAIRQQKIKIMLSRARDQMDELNSLLARDKYEIDGY